MLASVGLADKNGAAWDLDSSIVRFISIDFRGEFLLLALACMNRWNWGNVQRGPPSVRSSSGVARGATPRNSAKRHAPLADEAELDEANRKRNGIAERIVPRRANGRCASRERDEKAADKAIGAAPAT